MPELPEVQNFVNAIKQNYEGKTIESIVLRRDTIRFPLQLEALHEIFAKGSQLIQVARLGKQIRLSTTCGAVRVSLGMSGRFFAAEKSRVEKHEHITVCFSDGTRLGFSDPRRFGFWLVEQADRGEPTQEPVDALDAHRLGDFLLRGSHRGSARRVKDFLMDQKYIMGIGNIYACEILFLAKIHPHKSCVNINARQWKLVAAATNEVLQNAVAHGGSTISSYRAFQGNPGGFQLSHKVYQRTGDACLRPGCKGTVQRLVNGGRSSFFCAGCQVP